jgi:hypothetical protein
MISRWATVFSLFEPKRGGRGRSPHTTCSSARFLRRWKEASSKSLVSRYSLSFTFSPPPKSQYSPPPFVSFLQSLKRETLLPRIKMVHSLSPLSIDLN